MPTAPPLRVLIVDDNLDDRYAYRRHLARATDEVFEVREADCGETALQTLRQWPPDLVLLDFHLPDTTGMELLPAIREAFPHLPVILLTGLEDVNTSVAALKAGADDYQIKGKLSGDSLLRAIRSALERRGLEAALAAEKRRLALFYQLIEQSPDLLFVIAMPGRDLIEVNSGTCGQLGYLREALLAPGFEVSRVFPHFDEVWAGLSAENPSRRFDCEALRADGSRLPLGVQASRIHIGGRDYFVAVARDITDRLELEAQLRRLVLLDALTGVHNRRAFDERLTQEFGRAARGHGALGLLMVDIDHFKLYNDHYGHPAGDRCLRQVAQALTAALKRPSDFVARYGGEEFAVLLPDTDLAGAAVAAGQLLQRVRELELPHAAAPLGRVSVSIGVTAAVPPVRGLQDQFLAEADQRLYRAKHGGRNRLIDRD